MAIHIVAIREFFSLFSGKEPTLHESEPILMSECFQGRKIVKFDLSVGKSATNLSQLHDECFRLIKLIRLAFIEYE